jgi:hypothetical protein
MTTDLRPEALLALADRLQSGVDDPMWADHCEMSKRTCGLAAATLRALAAQSAQMSPESEQWTDEQFQRECIRRCISAGELLGYTAKSAEQIAAKRAAPSQPMAGGPVAKGPLDYATLEDQIALRQERDALRQRVAELEQLLKVMERQYAESLMAAADALERIQKMKPVAYLNERDGEILSHPPEAYGKENEGPWTSLYRLAHGKGRGLKSPDDCRPV